MQPSIPDQSDLSRREFLRRGALAGVGAAAATAFGLGRQKGSAATGGAIPTLDVAEQVVGFAKVPGRAIAVGSRDDQAAVWVHEAGDPSWTLAATGESFPAGAVLAAAASVDRSLIVVGHTRELSRVEVIVDDRTGTPMELPVYATVPGIFTSVDGSAWSQVQRGASEAELGSFGGVALVEDAGVLAIGFRSIEPGVGGPYGLVAMRSGDGRRWSGADLPGVVPPRHGMVTLLASIEGSGLLATRGVRETGLYRAAGGGWRGLGPPADRATFKAAASMDGDLLVAGVDDRGRARIWKGTSGDWSEVHGLPGLPKGARVVDLARAGSSLVAVAHHGGRSLVIQIEG